MSDRPFTGAHARAVVIESDDWGLAAWVPDEAAARELADAPAFTSAPGRRYGRSTLETAADVGALAALLGGVRGADGQPAVLQANTVMAAPDYARIAPGRASAPIPVAPGPELPGRWARPGLERALDEAIAAGVWWPELHGLHHLPEHAWARALSAGVADARVAFDQQCMVCQAVEASGEFDAREPLADRERRLARAVELFVARFGRRPGSFCPPDYRWDRRLDPVAARLGLDTFQGAAERVAPLAPLRRRWHAWRWPTRGARLDMPPRIAFEPLGRDAANAPLGAAEAYARCRAAWAAGRPAVVSTHRLNYAHLDAAFAEAGRRALGDLLARLAGDGAAFLVDAEVHALLARGWSARRIGAGRALVRCARPSAVEVADAPPGAALALARGDGEVDARGPRAVARLAAGVHVLTWSPA